MPVAIVTAASESFAGLVLGLVRSIRDAEAREGLAERVPVQVIDFGLAAPSIEALAPHCDVLREPRIPLPVQRTDHPAAFLLSRVVKAHLPDLFPGYETYLWIDADAWVQRWWAIDWLCRGAAAGGLAVVPEWDRSYSISYVSDSNHHRWAYDGNAAAFGREAAEALAHRPVFNAGTFAARFDSPVWAKWRARLEATFRAPRAWLSDQHALNVAVYLDGVPFYPMPSLCNWLCCHALPRATRDSLALTEPRVPFHDLGIVHLTTDCCHRELPVPWDAGAGPPLALDYLNLRRLRGAPREGGSGT